MCREKFLAVFFMLIFSDVFGQIQPVDGIAINYTQIMFDHPSHDGATHYILCIYPSNSKESQVLTIKTAAPAYLVKTGLSFGKQYQWYYEAWNKAKKIYQSGIFAFSTLQPELTDTTLYRFTIARKNENYIKDGIIFFDNPGVAVDRSGRVVWVLQLDSVESKTRDKVRNLHLTPYQTIMYLLNGSAAEKSISGQLLWKAPENTGTAGVGKDIFHHDCRRLNDGSYLLCNYRYELKPCLYSPSDTCQVRYNTILQMNSNGKAKWYWNEKGHVSNDDIFSAAVPTQRQLEGTHMNGFDYNEKQDALIMSFRNNSRIIKVDKKSGQILWEVQPPGSKNVSDVYFENQHGITFTNDGGVLVYNNSGLRLPLDEKEKAITWPTVIILKEQVPGEKPIKVWEYECVSPAFPKGVRGKEGYAREIPGKNGTNILVCMGGANRSFEVTRQKQVVWECFLQQFDAAKALWRPLISYRSHYASSLYPFYLSVQAISSKATKKKIGLTLFNGGSEDDTYKLELEDPSIQHFSAKAVKVSIKAGGSAMVYFPFLPKSNANKATGISISIRSQNSPAVKKSIRFNYQ
jgi:Arylsulfotransferase (ASST)